MRARPVVGDSTNERPHERNTRHTLQDEDYEGPGKLEAYERPAFKRRPIKNLAIQWALEDRKDYSKGVGIKYLGDK